jgi:putative acetyltransferase
MSEPSITIRSAEATDAEAIYQINSQPRVIWGTFQIPFPSLELSRKRLSEPADGTYTLVAVAEQTVVGILGIHGFPKPRRHHAAMIGMAVHDAWHRKGVGAELMKAAVDLADNWLNLHRLELEVYCDNESAIGLYRRFGFTVEGTLVDYAFRGGEYVNAFVMGRVLAAQRDGATPPS